jgi:aryl-alcohol dehydrogenase-like predicted oxidoreductase
VAQWVAAAERVGGARAVSIQNEYSLLCRLFDTDLAEAAVHEDVGLLAFSPLATGLLTGKYQGGQTPKGSRMTLNSDLGGRKTDRAFEAVAVYQDIADRHGLDLAQMSLAWCCTRPFMTSVIFGATSVAQLEHLLPAADLTLSQEVLNEINAAHRLHPMPY